MLPLSLLWSNELLITIMMIFNWLYVCIYIYIYICIYIYIYIYTRFEAWGTRVSRTVQSMRGKIVERLNVGAVVDNHIKSVLRDRDSVVAMRQWQYGHGDTATAIRPGRYGQGDTARAIRPGRLEPARAPGRSSMRALAPAR